jgi:hypothetical protein
MSLIYAVDRLYEVGWEPEGEEELERLPGGRRFPSVLAIQAEFARAGAELGIKYNVMFNCYRATWTCGAGSGPQDRGTVVGACEREAAVYALAQFRAAHAILV